MRTANVTLRTHGGHAIVDAARCPACGHPARIHNVVGCVHASCECVMSRDELTGDTDASATPPAQPATPPAPAAPAPADPPAAPGDVVEAPRDPAVAEPAAELVAPERPRRTQPRTAEGALVDPAGPSGGDADQVVTADRPPSEAVTTYLDPEALFAHALYVSSRWYCPRCHQWPLDPGACTGCKAPLQAVYHATIPREIT